MKIQNVSIISANIQEKIQKKKFSYNFLLTYFKKKFNFTSFLKKFFVYLHYKKHVKPMIYKSYDYYTRDGIKQTEWFEWKSEYKPEWQLKNKLRNYYKNVD